MTYNFADDLQVGDTIVIAESNYLRMGFFAGRGRNTIQFYTPAGVVSGMDTASNKNEEFVLAKHCYKAYVKDARWRIAKIKDPVFGDGETDQNYWKAVDTLKRIKFIKP